MAAILRPILLAAALAAIALPTRAQGTSAAASGTPDPKTEEGLRAVLDTIETRYEAACVRMNEASWRAAMGEADIAEAQLEAARNDLAAVYADPALDQAISLWALRHTVTRDPALSRRVGLWSKTREVAGVELDPVIFSLTNKLAARLRTHRFPLEGRQVTRAELHRIIATSQDRQARRRAWLAEAAFAGEVKADVRKLIRLRALKAQQTNPLYFHHLIYGGSEIDAYWAFALSRQVRLRTDARYDELIDSFKKTLGLESLEPWDLDYAQNLRTSQRGLDKAIAAAFPPGGAMSAARKLLEALGFDPSKVPIRAASVELGFGGALSSPVRVPDDIRLAADSTADGGGPRSYEAVFREFGRALQSAFNKQPAPILKGYRCIYGTRNEVFAESMAGTLGEFVRDPTFLEKYLGMDRKSIDLYLEDEADRGLVRFRRLLLNMGIEFAFYVNPDADLDERYRALLGECLKVNAEESTPITWPAHIAFITDPGLDLDQILALTVVPEALSRLEEALGSGRLGSGKAAPWMIEHFYASGELDELSPRLTNTVHSWMDFDKVFLKLGVTRRAPARP